MRAQPACWPRALGLARHPLALLTTLALRRATGGRAVANAAAAVRTLDKCTVDGKEIRLAISRAADDKEFTRYGDY